MISFHETGNKSRRTIVSFFRLRYKRAFILLQILSVYARNQVCEAPRLGQETQYLASMLTDKFVKCIFHTKVGHKGIWSWPWFPGCTVPLGVRTTPKRNGACIRDESLSWHLWPLTRPRRRTLTNGINVECILWRCPNLVTSAVSCFQIGWCAVVNKTPHNGADAIN